MRAPGGGSGGFTLLELLAALVVLGFILAGIAGGMQFGERATAVQARTIAAHADAGAADRVLRRLIAGMDPGTESDPPHITGTASALAFSTTLGDAAAALGATGEADVSIGVDSSRHLVLRWTPSLHAIRLVPAPAPREAVLLDGVQAVEFAYWGHGAGGGGEWLSGWGEREAPPLVRVRLHFMADAHRSWPDIVVATERQKGP